MSHAMQGHPRQTGHSEGFWQNVIHCRRVWQTAPVCLPQEPHELYKKAKRYEHHRMSSPGWKGSNLLLEKSSEQFLIAAERMKQLGQSRNYAWLWMCLVVKVTSDTVKNNIAKEPGMLGPWIKVNCMWSTGDGKTEHWYHRNQWTKLDVNEWI